MSENEHPDPSPERKDAEGADRSLEDRFQVCREVQAEHASLPVELLSDAKAANQLLPLIYDELRRLATQKLASQKPGQTLQATALVHEAYLRLVGQTPQEGWDNRRHFFAAAAEAMRRILIERARQKASLKRGGNRQRVELGSMEPAVLPMGCDDLLGLDEALRKLEQKDPRKAELVKLRFFAGLTTAQAAETLGVSTTTAENDWAYARSWLRLEIVGRGDNDSGS